MLLTTNANTQIQTTAKSLKNRLSKTNQNSFLNPWMKFMRFNSNLHACMEKTAFAKLVKKKGKTCVCEESIHPLARSRGNWCSRMSCYSQTQVSVPWLRTFTSSVKKKGWLSNKHFPTATDGAKGRNLRKKPLLPFCLVRQTCLMSILVVLASPRAWRNRLNLQRSNPYLEIPTGWMQSSTETSYQCGMPWKCKICWLWVKYYNILDCLYLADTSNFYFTQLHEITKLWVTHAYTISSFSVFSSL